MGRIGSKNPRYRTKKQMAEDAAFILNAPVTYGTKYAVLDNIAWTWTEFDGKYKGCPYWSKRAMRHLGKPDPKVLRHEHAVPRKMVIQMLLEMKSPTAKAVYGVCEKFLIGVVVTVKEDNDLNSEYRSSMPQEFFDPASPDYHNPLLRYEKCGIEVGAPPGMVPSGRKRKR